MPDSQPSPAPPADAPAAWLHARASEVGLLAGQVHAAPLSAGADGRIVLSSDAAASALPPVPGNGGVATFAAEEVHVAAGQTLVLTSPGRETLRVLFGALTVDRGGRVVVETPIELAAARTRVETVVELIGKDGATGTVGDTGSTGTAGNMTGGTGGRGGDGGRGDDGPGGRLWLGELTGTLIVLAGGGNGGDAGAGGQGGQGYNFVGRGNGGRGGVGGPGGRGGDAGNGGSVVIAFVTLAPGSSIQPLARPNAPGKLGGPGPAGPGGKPTYTPGSPGTPGQPGSPGEAPAFTIRCDTAV